ncbi:hypothetical protein HanRHA438_Chr03g0122671 [Helianthus annuus]|uniref:Uncharacterized protein n=1 Tax=Helianthus annuus TaxID=4232 RepID=A0A9K3NVY1_HELAN|nr:uncharacterized protein LOC110929520 [Helianthus annuus]KAF5814384.1 hypothetical protein HanXRQr2_Chr03g0110451 [Helianthus annuus]KAJ0600767.1 hypothetical protein HanIR_Chr03g0120861 [Helianthus annuus]KAJ0608028.1 hypothetical protein HanHA89_Chr03g0104041 [Helianthus annuus]KAJ0768091.1 hypothetical protein HanLR1_Chr03g0097391 [Helianthus annuus]KAJ0935713.1 hypothetical protein HanRHA438_Chr03g0122671 [Helianthus annuus]
MSTLSSSSDQSRAPGKAPAVTRSPPRHVETHAASCKRLAQGGESSSRPTHATPVNPVSTQTESALIRALKEYNRILIEQNQALIEQNQVLQGQVTTLQGRVESQEEQLQVLYGRTDELKQEFLKGCEVRGLLMEDARLDRNRINWLDGRLDEMAWRVLQLKDPGPTPPSPAPEPAPAPASPEPEEDPDEESEEIPEDGPEE